MKPSKCRTLAGTDPVSDLSIEPMVGNPKQSTWAYGRQRFLVPGASGRLAAMAGARIGLPQIAELGQGQKRFLGMSEKFIDLSGSVSKEGFNGFRRAIAESNPENLRWMPFDETSLTKISVFGDDREFMLGRVCPDRRVCCFPQPDITDMNAAGETVSQPFA